MRYKVNSVVSQKQGCPINLVAENLQQMTHNFYTIHSKQLNWDRLRCKCCKCFPDVFLNKQRHMAPYEEERCTAHTFRSNWLATLCDSWCENDWQTCSKSIYSSATCFPDFTFGHSLTILKPSITNRSSSLLYISQYGTVWSLSALVLVCQSSDLKIQSVFTTSWCPSDTIYFVAKTYTINHLVSLAPIKQGCG